MSQQTPSRPDSGQSGHEAGAKTVAGPSAVVPADHPSAATLDAESDRRSDMTTPTTTATAAGSNTERPLLKPSSSGHSDVNAGSDAPRSTSSSEDGGDEPYPEGGFRAWLVVFGCWLALFASLGLMNIMATFDTYLTAKQLVDHDAGAVGGIVFLYSFLSFALGIYVGPIFDRYGPRWPILGGTVCVVTALVVVSISTQYYHLLVSFGVLSGLGSALLFTPSIAAIGHFFNERRGFATGVATTAGAISAVVFPFMVQQLFVKVGWPWAMRALALVCLAVLIGANFLVRSRLPPAKHTKPHPNPRIFATQGYTLTVIAVFLMQFASFIPLSYLSAYVLSKGLSNAFSFDVLTILNASSAIGRVVAGFSADKVGAFNANIMFSLITSIACFGIWHPVGATKGGLIAFALIFGFTSGSNISLIPVTIGKLCKTRDYGKYYGTCYTVVSLAVMVAIPVAGKVVRGNRGDYWGLTIVSGVFYLAAAIVFAAAKISVVGMKPWLAF
ncbi:putative transporter [Podospora australis]|uniref:Transporter n=1 Tax=Podospora australis TaxID=1536484 RepID=A0AAN6WW44_9PEZI|nr:putative transporter [Podospora australis]